MLLANDTVRLRAIEPEDLELLYMWENDPAFWLVGNTLKPYSRYELKNYIEQMGSDIYEQKQLRFMICNVANGQTIGTVDLFDFDVFHQRLALGLFVDANHTGKGFATSALQLVEQYVFNFLSVHQLYVHIATDNVASMSMFEKSHFSKNAVLKQWIRKNDTFVDVALFQKFKNTIL